MISVLYVDDESALLDIAKMYLEKTNEFSVTTATSAQAGLNLLKSEKIDAIVSDYQMPGMGGIQFLIEVRTRFGPIPFILFTGKSREEGVIQAINNGADFYLQKGGEHGALFTELSHKIKQATSRKMADDALRKSEEKYRHLIEHSNEAIVVAQDGMLRLVNHRAVEFTGYSEQELLSMSFLDFIHPDDRAMVMERYQKRMKSEELPTRYAFRLCPKDASTRWVEISVAAIDWEGHPATLNFLTDITERKQAEEALVESEIKYRNLAETLQDLIITTDLEGIITYANPVARNLVEEGGLVGMPLKDFVDQEQVTWHREMLNARRQGLSETLSFEWHITSPKDGSSLIFDVRSSLLIIDKGSPSGILFNARDITERKRAEEALAESEETFRVHIENSFDVIFTLDSEGIFVFISPAWERHFGYPVSDVIGKTFAPFVHPDDVAPLVEYLKRVLITGQSETSPAYRVKHADGRWLWFIANGTPYANTKGERQFIGVARDITERKRAEEALAESEERYRTILQTTMDGFWMIDVLDGKVTDVNETYCRMSGYTRSELLKMHIPDLDAKKTLDEQAATLQSIITNGSGIFETRHHRKDGSVFDVELSVTYQNTNGGELICFCRDITERKRAEEALRQANKQLNLLSGITRHDILNQLFALKGYLELSHDVIDKPETLKEFIKKEQQAANTIEQQITFTRDYQNLGVTAPAWQNVNARIKEAVDRLPMRAVRVEVDPANPEVYADPLFEKVFYNLLDNALRYGGDQMKTIRISSQESGTSLAILCENDGVGLTAEDKKHLFSRGFGKNTGLGLFLSREILAITGITILETGKPGNGARFEITVPTGMWRTAGTGA